MTTEQQNRRPMDEKTISQALGAIPRTPSRVSEFTEPKVDFELEIKRYRACLLEVEPRFNPDHADRDILNSIFAWIWKRDDLNKLGLDYEKGFFLYGPLGLGKSMTLQAMRRYMNSVKARHHHLQDDYRLGSWWKSASEIANIYAADGQPALLQYTGQDINLVIDEFGREPIPASNYGTKMNVLQFVLQLRYDHRRSSVTHITTNLTLEQIEPRYGDYVADRCKEMFNFIEFEGKSLR